MKRYQVRWDQLTHVEFMVNGSRCTIYTAFYETTPVVVKVMRKDVQDKDIVRQVCASLCSMYVGSTILLVPAGVGWFVGDLGPHGWNFFFGVWLQTQLRLFLELELELETVFVPGRIMLLTLRPRYIAN